MIKKITEVISVLLLSAAILCVSASFLFKNRAEYVQSQIDYDQFKATEKIKELVVSEINCLAKNVYYEAKGEKFEGKLAVAQVTLNRTKSPDYPHSICDVVYQKEFKNGKWECQFSWTCSKNIKEPDEKYIWEESQYIARKALTLDDKSGNIHIELADKNATFFHATYIHPKTYVKSIWNKVERVATIGKHIFYTLKG